MIEEQEVEGEFDTARRYDEVIEMGEDSALEDEGLERWGKKADSGGLPRNNDLKAVQNEDQLELQPESSQKDKQSVQSESVPKQDEEFQQVLQKFEASEVAAENKCATSQESSDGARHNQDLLGMIDEFNELENATELLCE